MFCYKSCSRFSYLIWCFLELMKSRAVVIWFIKKKNPFTGSFSWCIATSVYIVYIRVHKCPLYYSQTEGTAGRTRSAPQALDHSFLQHSWTPGTVPQTCFKCRTGNLSLCLGTDPAGILHLAVQKVHIFGFSGRNLSDCCVQYTVCEKAPIYIYEKWIRQKPLHRLLIAFHILTNFTCKSTPEKNRCHIPDVWESCKSPTWFLKIIGFVSCLPFT